MQSKFRHGLCIKVREKNRILHEMYACDYMPCGKLHLREHWITADDVLDFVTVLLIPS